ncbi:MAG: SHOCT domain-containing protein [Oscillospiraceae bacterium]|nr:SHOCT domain-containing protein [Oscillospiraceae bacterium]
MPKKIITCFPLQYTDKQRLLKGYFREMIRELNGTNTWKRLLYTYTILFLSEYIELDRQQRTLLFERLRSETVQTNALNGILSELFANLPKSQPEPEQPIDVPLYSNYDEDGSDEDDFDDDLDEEYDDDEDENYEQPSRGLLSKLIDWFYPEEATEPNYSEQLRELKGKLESGEITKEEFTQKKQEILDQMI